MNYTKNIILKLQQICNTGLLLELAINMDSLFVGMSFAFLRIPILEPSIIIGCTTFFLSFCGVILDLKSVIYSSKKSTLLVAFS